jgi:hypothetical protein
MRQTTVGSKKNPNFSVASSIFNKYKIGKLENHTLQKMKRKCPFMWETLGNCAYRLLETFWPNLVGIETL